MEALISSNLHRSSNPLLSPLLPLPSTRRFTAKGAAFFLFPRRQARAIATRRAPVLCGVTASPDLNSTPFGGWELLEPEDESRLSAELNPIRYFLISVGIGQNKDAFLFFFGFLSALAISRVRISTMAILPVSVLVFIAGLSVGVVQGDVVGSVLSREGGKRSQSVVEVSNTLASSENTEILVGFFNNLDIKMSDLRAGLERAVGSNHLERDQIKNYIEVVESVRLAALPMKKFSEDTLESNFIKEVVKVDLDGERKFNQKSSRKKKELDITGFDFLHFIAGFFPESLLTSKYSKAKSNIKSEPEEEVIPLEKGRKSNSILQNNGDGPVKDNTSSQVASNIEANVKIDATARSAINGMAENSESPSKTSRENRYMKAKYIKEDCTSGTSNSAPVLNGKQLLTSKYGTHESIVIPFDELSDDLDRTFQYTSKHRSFESENLRYVKQKENTRTQRKNLEDSSEIETKLEPMKAKLHSLSESESSLCLQSSVEIQSRTYLHSHGGLNQGRAAIDQGDDLTSFKDARSVENRAISFDQKSKPVAEAANDPLLATVSVDDEFNQKLKEGSKLIKHAREYMKNDSDDEMTEIILYKSAKLLSTAVALKPRSLLALGKLGNTFLLHGELKLKISRELRSLLSQSDSLDIEKARWSQLEGSADLSIGKEKFTSVLVDVCEECEEFLVEAGKNYKRALSIDGSDVRALYNWGLALYFRGQLIGDIGPRAASDADKVYLAAIDKFAAMASLSNSYTADALFRWGIVLQQRSHLHLRDRKQKIELLKQAKSLYEDALRQDSKNPLVREALFSCISELNYRRQLQ